MTSSVLGAALVFFRRPSLHKLSLQAASSHRPIAFDPEGSSLDLCLSVIIQLSSLHRSSNSIGERRQAEARESSAFAKSAGNGAVQVCFWPRYSMVNDEA